jgi:hypothetical protein
VLFTQLWEQPDQYRGERLQLRLHIKRALSHEAPANPADVKRVYEAWGWTEESRSFPYLVVFSELPPQMTLGPDIQEEAVFVGYFLKLMSYQAYDAPRAAPLLVGQLQRLEDPAHAMLQDHGGDYFWPTAIAGCLFVLAIVGSWFIKSRKHPTRPNPSTPPAVADADWLARVEAACEEGRLA